MSQGLLCHIALYNRSNAADSESRGRVERARSAWHAKRREMTSRNARDSCSGGPRFETRLRHWLSSSRFSVDFMSFQANRGSYPIRPRQCFLPNPLQFIYHPDIHVTCSHQPPEKDPSPPHTQYLTSASSIICSPPTPSCPSGFFEYNFVCRAHRPWLENSINVWWEILQHVDPLLGNGRY
jgi:hypothetical protein